MIEPEVPQPWWRHSCKKIVTVCGNIWVKHLVYPMVVVLPPVVAMAVVRRPEWQTEAASFVGGDWGERLLNVPSLSVLILAPIYVIGVKFIYALIKAGSKPSKELSKGDMMSVLMAIEAAVEEKSKRMASNAKRIRAASNVCGKETFSAITLPEQQVPLLIKGIHSVFEFLSENKVEYKVGLLKIENDLPVDWLTFYPLSIYPSLSAKALGARNSTVMCCIRAKKMVVVEDIKKELQRKKKPPRYIPTSEDADDEGSQLCYPIVHSATGKIEHVITIAGHKPCSLIEQHAVLYEWFLKHFVVRINMEQSLLFMKEKANESDN